MWIQAWVLEKARMGRVLEISGTRKNVRIAEYIHTAICRYIDGAWADYRRNKRPESISQNRFCRRHHRRIQNDVAAGICNATRRVTATQLPVRYRGPAP
jgi:hypothetical protein